MFLLVTGASGAGKSTAPSVPLLDVGPEARLSRDGAPVLRGRRREGDSGT